MVKSMDRRQRKTREAIFNAFTQLLAKRDFNQITVGEIIHHADVGRATFYAHFETKEYLLKEFCEELFCHLFDVEHNREEHHHHIFDCDGSESPILHLFEHLQKDDNHILGLLSCQNNQLFLQYFRENLTGLVQQHSSLFASHVSKNVPAAFWQNHIVSTLAETIRWWIAGGLKESPQVITEYFFNVL